METLLYYVIVLLIAFLTLRWVWTLNQFVSLRRDFKKRVSAYFLNKVLVEYHKTLKPYKDELFSSIEPGLILEIGVGPGANLDYYQDGTRLLVCDPNDVYNEYVLEKLKDKKNVKLEKFIVGGAEDLSQIESSSVSSVVCTLVLCTVRDIDRVLQEVLRVLEPGGKFYFLEHVLAKEGTTLYYFHRFIKPMWSFMADGCRTTRQTWKNIERAGFSEVHHRKLYILVKPTFKNLTMYLLRTHIVGYAVK